MFQAAIAAGEGVGAAIGSGAIGEVIGTRSGGWMLGRLVAWIAIAFVWTLAARRARRGSIITLLVLGAVAAQLPALIGHAATSSPAWLMVVLDFTHVVAMSVWVGGLAAGLFALPHATSELTPPQRTRLLVGTFDRFSVVALTAVGALVVSGIAQSLAQFDAISELTTTAYGRAVLIKSIVLLFVIGLAAVNRFRALPRLRAEAEGARSPGAAGVLLRRTLAAELALTIGAILVASALVGYAPAKAASAGPFVAERKLGAAQLQIVVDPARTGANQMHLYLTDPASGAQFQRFDQLNVSIARVKPPIGPISLKLTRAGPGHYVVQDARFIVQGTWSVDITMRTGEFDQAEQRMAVKIK